MTTLKVPGAELYYEKRGTGPVLLLIPGGSGDTGPYGPLSAALSDRYTVVSYDRRGFSRSTLDGPVDRDTRLDADVADAVALLDEVGDGPAYVFGSSSGAIVGLHLLARHPEHVRTLVAHEPPLLTVLPDAEEWREFFVTVVDTFRAEGVQAAMTLFMSRMGFGGGPRPSGPQPTPSPEALAMMERVTANQAFWLENEVPTYPVAEPDLDVLAGLTDKLVLAGGVESREFFPYQPNLFLAERFGLKIVDFPGNHIGYVFEPATFPGVLDDVLKGR